MHKIKTIIFSLFLFMISDLSAQEMVKLTSFDEIDVSGNIRVTLEEGEPMAYVKMLKGEREDLMVEVVDGVLRIKFKNRNKGWNNGNGKAELHVGFTQLEYIDVSAGASLDTKSTVKSESMGLDVSSGASVSLDLETTNLSVDISSGASVSLSGSTNKQVVEASSGASYRAGDMDSNITIADASSGASIKVRANEEIDAEASSGASIRYKGDPSVSDIEVGKYSGGSISKM